LPASNLNGDSKMQKLVDSINSVMRTSQLLTVCPITGLSSTLNVPAIDKKYIVYNNPISNFEVAKQLSSLSAKELSVYDIEILAGIFLSLASKFRILEDKASSVERNILLRTNISAYSLISAIHVLSSLSNIYPKLKSWESFPKFDTLIMQNSMFAKESFSSFISLLKDEIPSSSPSLANTDFLSEKEKEEIDVFLFSKPKLSNKKQLESYRIALKAHTKVLKSIEYDGIVSKRLVETLELLQYKDSLVTVSLELRTKIITILKGYFLNHSIKEAEQIASILEKTSPKFVPTISDFDRPSDLVKTRKTLAEILEDRKNANRISEEDTNEVLYVSSLSNTNEEEIEDNEEGEENEF
jgi:hypothetical protein